jgi:6-phosphogluconolactonase (cycloisomerase 2 family)
VLGVAPNLSGLDAIAVTPDGGQVYGVTTAQDALVVVNADGTQRQLFTDGAGGINHLNGARDVAVSSDGRHVYVASAEDRAITVFARDAATGNLALHSFVVAAGPVGTFDSIVLNDAGTRLWTAGPGGINAFTRTTAGTLVQLPGTVAGTYSEIEVSRDGSLLYAVSRAADQLRVFDAATLTLVQTLSGAALGLDGAADVAVSGDDRFVYVTGQDGNTLTVFERATGQSTLARVQTVTNGDGVRGMAEPTDVTVTADGQFVLVTGTVSNAVAVFQRDAATGHVQFVQVVRNNVGGAAGLLAPSAIATSGSRTYVGSLGAPGLLGGLAAFDNESMLPAPIVARTTFDAIEALGVTTGGGDDTITLRVAPEPEVASTTFSTGDGRDTVVLADLSASTTVHLGARDDRALLQASRDDAGVVIHGEGEDDTIEVERVGGGTALAEVFGGDGRDIVRVSGANLPATTDSSPRLVAHGGDPDGVPASEGDRLVFDPQDPTPGSPNFEARDASDARRPIRARAASA